MNPAEFPGTHSATVLHVYDVREGVGLAIEPGSSVLLAIREGGQDRLNWPIRLATEQAIAAAKSILERLGLTRETWLDMAQWCLDMSERPPERMAA